MAREAPMPHSPPMATPNRKRSTNNMVSEVENAVASSNSENRMTSSMRMGRLP